ncbi:YoaK family protein [Streptomyces sp. NPDC020681]|uniref:YoaK family protein n=1 Tax=Streptomyces sp. NPDC020681 TaxID=3365083 RepID=UPI0037B8CCE0
MKSKPGVTLAVVMAALTLTTGMVEAVSFLVLGPVFTAVQTGNLLLLGFAAAGEGGLSAAASVSSLAGFVVGALLGARFESSVDAHGHRWFVVALVAEAMLLGLAGVGAWGIGEGEDLAGRHFVVIATVAAAMGLRNVTTMRAHVPDMPTTVATRALTAFLGVAPITVDPKTASRALIRGRRAASIGAMFAGGLLGAWLLGEAVRPAVVLLLVAGVVLVTAAGFGFVSRHRILEPAERG